MISPLDMCMFLKEKLKLYNVLLLNACLKILRTIFDLSAEIIGPKSQALETKNFEINGLKYKNYRPLTNHILRGLGSNGTANRLKVFLLFLMVLTHHGLPNLA